jgi:hypothetical protein
MSEEEEVVVDEVQAEGAGAGEGEEGEEVTDLSNR